MRQELTQTQVRKLALSQRMQLSLDVLRMDAGRLRRRVRLELARNPALQHDYQRFIDDELTDTLHGLFVRCADAGLFAIDAADIRPLVINIWLVVKFWYAFEQASHPSQPISEATGRRGVRQVLALLKPYVTATLRPAFIAACARYGEA